LEPVLRVHFCHGGEVRGSVVRETVGNLLEVLFEIRRRNDFQNFRRFVTGVPEGVPLAPRLPYGLTGAGIKDLFAQEESNMPSGDNGEFIFTAVHVKGRCKFSGS
jgi:hypothetical protein